MACLLQVHPKMAVTLAQRFPAARAPLEKLLAAAAHEPSVQAIPEAALMLATQEVRGWCGGGHRGSARAAGSPYGSATRFMSTEKSRGTEKGKG